MGKKNIANTFLCNIILLCIIWVNWTWCEVRVTTKNGDVIGMEDQNFLVFKGIPYAEPPVAQNRWKAPLPKQPWYPNVWNATSDPSACPQPTCERIGNDCVMDEDCLYLNIWTPESVLRKKTLVPVMVYFYGGGFEEGANRYPVFHGDWFSNTSSLVVVTFNYRVGALGWLVYGNFTGNFGLQDQRLVLQWVRDNIQSFGGDPNIVTVFGQSAGAISIGTHMTSPLSQGLFHRAIMESNPFAMRFRSMDLSYALGDIFGYWIGCTSEDEKCLLSKTWKEVLAAQANTYFVPYTYLLDELPWQPTLDGKDVKGQTLDLIRKGNLPKIPVILGTVREEMHSFIYGATSSNISSSEYDALVVGLFPTHFPAVFDQYPSGDDPKETFSELMTDFLFFCPTWAAATALAEHNISAYLYIFLHPPAHDPENNTTFCQNHVCHGAELEYVWHLTYPLFNFTKEESLLSWAMNEYWALFANTGQPGTEWLTVNSVEGGLNPAMGFDIPTPNLIYGYRQEKCTFWEQLGYWK